MIPELMAPPARPAVLVYDLETAPINSWVWRRWKPFIAGVEQDDYGLSVAYKWLNVKMKPQFHAIWDDPYFEPDSFNDAHIAAVTHQLFDWADVVIAHNNDRFDQKVANTWFLKNGLGPAEPFQSIDTLKVAKAHFRISSNKLDDLGEFLGVGRKTKHAGFDDLWRPSMAGDSRAQRRMQRYNEQDVRLLEKVYFKLLPWIGHPGTPLTPNAQHWDPEKRVCPKIGCGGTTIKRGIHRTIVSEFQTWQCKRCGGYSRSRYRVKQHDGGVTRR